MAGPQESGLYFRKIGTLILLVGWWQGACGQAAKPAAEALAADAASARDRGDVPQAISLYKQAVAADPQWADGWWFLGNLQYRVDQFAPARESLSRFIDLSPKAVAALALRGLCEYETAQYPEALADIEQALALGAANQQRNANILLFHEALLLTRMGRFEEAIAKYTVFAKNGTTNPQLAMGLGLAGLRMPVLPQAVSPADLQLAGMSGEAGFKILAGDAEGGRQAFAKVLEAYPHQANVHFFCGYLLLSTDPDGAVEEMQAELTVVPTSVPAHTMLAWTLELRGDFGEALPVAQAAIGEDAQSATNQLVLGRALLETGDAKGALDHLDQALTADQGNLEAHMSLAKAYSELGRKDEAHEQRMLCLQLTAPGPKDKGGDHASQ